MSETFSALKKIDVAEMIGEDTLVGKGPGKRDFPAFAAAVVRGNAGDVVVWDWSSVQLCTASYFAEAFIPLINMASSGGLDRFFIVSGVKSASRDELDLALGIRTVAVLHAKSSSARELREALPIGPIEPVYLSTFAAVITKGRVSATQLHSEQPKDTKAIGKTGWVNRLVYLNERRLLRKVKLGREFFFQHPMLEVANG